MINNVFVGDAIALLRHDSDPTEAALRDEIAAREPWLSVLNVEWVAKEVLRQGPVKAADDAEREKVRRTANAALAITIVRELANKAYDLDESRLATLVGGHDTTLSPAKMLGAVKACVRWSHAQIDGWWEKAEYGSIRQQRPADTRQPRPRSTALVPGREGCPSNHRSGAEGGGGAREAGTAGRGSRIEAGPA